MNKNTFTFMIIKNTFTFTENKNTFTFSAPTSSAGRKAVRRERLQPRKLLKRLPLLRKLQNPSKVYFDTIKIRYEIWPMDLLDILQFCLDQKSRLVVALPRL